MTFSLGFDVEHNYSGAEGPTVSVTLSHGSDRASFDADIDTGSTFCIFNRGTQKRLASTWSQEI
jgi:hypothetical protein